LRAEIGGMPRILNNSLTYYSFGLSVSLSTSMLHIKSYMRENVSLLIKDKIELPERVGIIFRVTLKASTAATLALKINLCML
jgi:hypothetical protein